MRNGILALLALPLALALGGCGDDGDTIIGSTGGVLNNEDSFPASPLFSNSVWAPGGGFSPDGNPAFDVQRRGAETPVGVAVASSHPVWGMRVPYGWNDIRRLAFAATLLSLAQIELITNSYNLGLPNDVDDVVVNPSYSTFMPGEELYRIFQIGLLEDLEAIAERSGDPTRTQVVGIAFGNGQGGFVPVEPYTDDTFAGALAWMKATRNPANGQWLMDQREWRNNPGVDYATSLRMVIRGDAVVVFIRAAELEQLGITQFRWDTFSYTTDPSTDWSHDFTNWTPIGE